MKSSCVSAMVLGLCVLQSSAWPLDGLFGAWTATTPEPSTGAVSEHEAADNQLEKKDAASHTQPVNLHAHNAAQSADVAEQAAKVSKRVAAHTEQVAHDTAAALRYTQEALKRANAKSEDIAEVGKEAEKLEEEAGSSESTSSRGEAAKTSGKGEAESTSNTAARSQSDSESGRSSNLDTNDADSSSSISRDGADPKVSETKTSDTKTSKNGSNGETKTSKSGGSRDSGSSDTGAAGGNGGNGATDADGANGGNSANGGKGGDGKHLDVNSQIVPYPSGVEPFGQEEPAKELTKASVKHSDGMVDQIENAQGTEAKRSVYRALTKLRGATIASYDGIAKGHLKNVDRYNAQHKWRDLHPMKHLAQEEADTHIWAFPKKGFKKGKSPKAAAAPAPAGSDAPAAAEESEE